MIVHIRRKFAFLKITNIKHVIRDNLLHLVNENSQCSVTSVHQLLCSAVILAVFFFEKVFTDLTDRVMMVKEFKAKNL